MENENKELVLALLGVVSLLGGCIYLVGWRPITVGAVIIVSIVILERGLKLWREWYEEREKELKSKINNLKDTIRDLEQVNAILEIKHDRLNQRLIDVKSFFKNLKPETQESVLNVFDNEEKEGDDLI